MMKTFTRGSEPPLKEVSTKRGWNGEFIISWQKGKAQIWSIKCLKGSGGASLGTERRQTEELDVVTRYRPLLCLCPTVAIFRRHRRWGWGDDLDHSSGNIDSTPKGYLGGVGSQAPPAWINSARVKTLSILPPGIDKPCQEALSRGRIHLGCLVKT